MQKIIDQKLKDLARQHDVRILLACESGSRAWGFPSPDSDYDVRFIYVHRQAHYLAIDEQRDVIELPINDLLDINGWELRKALRLLRKSNSPLMEWLQSPVVYHADARFMEDMTGLMAGFFSPRAMMHHYLSMAKNVIDTDLQGAQVRLKKYFYALRPMLACRWIADRQQVPPMNFATLRTLLAPDLQGAVDDLLVLKATHDEAFTIQPAAAINNWLQQQVAYCESHAPDSTVPPASEPLNELFRKYVI